MRGARAARHLLELRTKIIVRQEQDRRRSLDLPFDDDLTPYPQEELTLRNKEQEKTQKQNKPNHNSTVESDELESAIPVTSPRNDDDEEVPY